MTNEKDSDKNRDSGSNKTGSATERVTTRTRPVTILNDDNFGVWKWNLKYNLKSLGLYKCVTTENFGTPQQRDEAMLEIISTLDDRIKIKVSHCDNPIDLFQAIEAIYTNKTSFQVTALHMKLSSFKFVSTEKISEGISEIQNIVSKLKNLGQQVSDHMVEGIVLAALPNSFRTFVTVWKGMSEAERTLSNLFNRIMAEIEDNKLFNTRDDKALLARGRKFKGRNGTNNNRSTPPTGQRKSDGKQFNKNDQSGNRSKPKGNCHYCKKPGHWINECRKLEGKRKEKPGSNDRNQQSRTESTKQMSPSKVKRFEKMKHYFDVEKILKHRNKEGRREFLIKWKNSPSSENTWEPEEHLDGCLDLLQKYCRDNKLDSSKVIGYYGNFGSDHINRSNWVSMARMLDRINKYKQYAFPKLNLPIVEWSGELPKCDSIIIFPLRFHIYVILYHREEELCYVADGGNTFSTSVDVYLEMRELLGTSLVGCEFNSHGYVDYCGSAAVIIALEMRRAYGNNVKPISLNANKTLSRRIIKSFHIEQSKAIRPKDLHRSKSKFKCQKCERGFLRRRSLLAHQAQCHGKGMRMSVAVISPFELSKEVTSSK